jgi:hypothetical protein
MASTADNENLQFRLLQARGVLPNPQRLWLRAITKAEHFCSEAAEELVRTAGPSTAFVALCAANSALDDILFFVYGFVVVLTKATADAFDCAQATLFTPFRMTSVGRADSSLCSG